MLTLVGGEPNRMRSPSTPFWVMDPNAALRGVAYKSILWLGPGREAVRRAGGLAWIGLRVPSEEEFSTVAGEFRLHLRLATILGDKGLKPRSSRH